METFSLASSISTADTAVKAANLELIEVRLGRGLGGKSFLMITGEVAAVEAAMTPLGKRTPCVAHRVLRGHPRAP